MAVPDFQSLMLPVLMATADGEISASALRDRVAASLSLSAEDLHQMLPSGKQTTFTNRTAWANVFLQRAGLIERAGRGVYRATRLGTQILTERPSKIDMTFLERFPSYGEWRQRSAGGQIAKPDGDNSDPLTAETTATPRGTDKPKLSDIRQRNRGRSA